MKYPHHDENWLRKREEGGLTIDEMMDEAGVTKKERFRDWLDKYNVCPSDCICCPNCDSIVQSAGRHWNQGGCGFPEINEEKWELLKGLVMGDGCVHHTENSTNPHFTWHSISYEHMSWFHEKMGWLSTGEPVLFESGKSREQAKGSQKTGFNPNAQAENYSDQYTWYSVSHPDFQEFLRKFYPHGEKKMPEDLILSPNSLKIWYCGDGSLVNEYQPRISSSKYMWESKEHLKRVFGQFPFKISINEEQRSMRNGKWEIDAYYIYCKGSDTSDFFDYIGKAPLGMEYKWPEN